MAWKERHAYSGNPGQSWNGETVLATNRVSRRGVIHCVNDIMDVFKEIACYVKGFFFFKNFLV